MADERCLQQAAVALCNRWVLPGRLFPKVSCTATLPMSNGLQDFNPLRPFLRALENPVRKWYPPPFSHWIFQQSFLRALENAHFLISKSKQPNISAPDLESRPKKHLARLCFLLVENGGVPPPAIRVILPERATTPSARQS